MNGYSHVSPAEASLQHAGASSARVSSGAVHSVVVSFDDVSSVASSPAGHA